MSDRITTAIKDDEIFYPESDGKPMADNTKQFNLIVKTKEGLEYQFLNQAAVFVAGDLLWYPVQGHPEISMAPDVMVVFGRPKGDRGSYRQWQEGNIAPQVVFEIWSPSNKPAERANKLDLYERYGVEEYYNFDPDTGVLEGWLRQGTQLERIVQMRGWISPRLGIRFEVIDGELELFHPDGTRFRSYSEEAQLAQQERQRAEQERMLSTEARQQAEQERQRAEQEKVRAEQEQAAKERAWAKLRELGIDPESLS